jgi:hypothetical protein
MSDTILSANGQPLFTPEELAVGVSVPARSNNDPTSPFRLCEYDLEAQSGCRRTQTLLALEAEYDTFVSPEIVWGFWDQWCQHEGNIYYYKSLIQAQILQDEAAITDDDNNQNNSSHVNIVCQYMGYEYNKTPTKDEVFAMFRNPPPGFPELQIETPQFFQCRDVTQHQITIDSLDRPTLNKIQASFSGNKCPLLADVAQSLYLDGDSVYCTDFLAFEENTVARLGVLMIPTQSEKYNIGDAYFFPFAPLSEEQKTFITSLGLLETNMQGNVVIVDL